MRPESRAFVSGHSVAYRLDVLARRHGAALQVGRGLLDGRLHCGDAVQQDLAQLVDRRVGARRGQMELDVHLVRLAIGGLGELVHRLPKLRHHAFVRLGGHLGDTA